MNIKTVKIGCSAVVCTLASLALAQAEREDHIAQATSAGQEALRLYQLGNYSDAERLALHAIELAKSQSAVPAARNVLGQIYLEKGANNEAFLTLVVGWRPGSVDPKRDLLVSIAALRNNRASQAKAYMQVSWSAFGGAESLAATRIGEPDLLPSYETDALAEARALLLLATDQTRRLEVTLADLHRAEKLVPGNPITAYLLGNAYVQKGEKALGVQYLRRAVETGKGKLRELAQSRLIAAEG